MCLAISKRREQLWQGQEVTAHVSVPLESNPSVCPFAQASTWVRGGDLLKAFRGLCQPCPARGDSFSPWDGPSSSPSDARWGSKLLHPVPTPAAGTLVGTAAVPLGGGHPPWSWH